MDKNQPIAFLSYVQNDDVHDHGRITLLRQRLEGELRMQTGETFRIFQDKKDIKWGELWKQRIESTILSVTFLIPVITPSYFRSTACREEFEKFSLREVQIGQQGLILPIYYLDADEIDEASNVDGDKIAKVVASRNWANWRPLRFEPLTAPTVGIAIADMAKTVKAAMKEMRGIISAADASVCSSPNVNTDEKPTTASLSTFSAKIPAVRVRSRGIGLDRPSSAYYCYTNEYDEEVHAQDLSDQSELGRLLAKFRKMVALSHGGNSALIERTLAAIKNNASSTSVSVTLLLDNSGSMRGSKINATAVWAFIASAILEKLEIPTQVLGFTTRAWRGGNAKAQWIKDGKPKLPGRLNELRHIIYKSFSDNLKMCERNFAVMQQDRVLKENIDGEALLWAHNRAEKYGSDRSILIILSDGAPVDDATLETNDPSFLIQHLHATVKWLSEKQRVAIYAVGVEFDCSRVYEHSIFIEEVKRLGEGFLGALPLWLQGPH